ncbi:MAG: SMP-30/gluconolactonase/LRE family protein [Psychromonas sp.]
MQTIKTLATLDMQLGECPRWNDLENAWYWVDITGKTLYRYDTQNDSLASRVFNFKPACFAFSKSNQIILTTSAGLFLLEDFSAEEQFLVHPESNQPQQRFNDGVPTPNGDLLAGSIGDENLPQGNLYHFEIDAKGVNYNTVCKGFRIVNGQAFSPDGKWFYVTDTPTQKILKYPFDRQTKQLGEAQLFYKFTEQDEYPDGAAVDADGNYWIAMYGTGKVCIISPQGNKIDEIFLPVSQPTMIAFGGKELDKLIVTSAAQGLTDAQLTKQPLAGSVLIIDVDQKGTLPYRLNSIEIKQ